MVCMPSGNVAVLKVAVVTPPDVLTFVGLPRFVPSTWNWTVPVGAPAPGAMMPIVAVKVTVWPDTDGEADDVITRLVLALATVWVTLPLLLARLPSPL